MHLLLLALVIVARLALGVSPSHAAVPAGFQETVVASVSQPSVIGFAPDGRLFIGEKASGRIRIYKNGALLAQPFLDVNAFVPAGTYFDTFNERGLLGMAFDPSFAANGFLYVYYSVCKSPANPPQPGTNTCGSAKNRVVRFAAAGDVVDATSPVVLLDDIDNDGGNHNAGWVGLGPLDGKLYVAIGDGGSFSAKAQNMGSLNGKILRLNADGTIPADNPFVTQAGARGEIWALGVRNPFRCRFAADGRLFCGDVGANGWEEVDLITKGANYGWPTTEGPFNATSFPQFTAPIHAYAHSTSVAIIGGDFGAKTSFPGDYQQSYFFGDFAIGRIQRALLSPSGTTVQSIQDFATSLGGNSVTDLIAGPDGSLYYTAYGANQVRRITATSTNRSPVAVASADVTSGPPPLLVQFSAAGSSDPDRDAITYSWNFGDGSATSALASPSHQFTVKGTHTVTLTVSDGKATPGPGTDTLIMTVGTPPMPSIAAPLDGASFRAGDTIPLQGSASDSEDGVLPASSLHWRVIFHHADHYHPYIDDLPGSASSFTTATSGEPDSDVAYEIILTATDSSGLSNTTSVVIVPVTSDFTLQTSPAGLGVTLDGQPKTAPVTTTGVVGLRRVIGAPPVQTVGAATYYFAGWSDGGLPTHEIVTPELDATFSASFMPPATCSAPVVLPAQGGTFTTATSGGSNQGGTCSTSTNSPEQVFQWTPAASGTATIATCGGATSFDTVLYVRSGTCDTGTQVACADDVTGCGTTEPATIMRRARRSA
jgi:glucose/arabinose dehydrogenase